jgi:DNA-binding NarL/FixJ family response regulator
MGVARKFLVVDFHAESRYLLVKTLLRKFHDAIVHEIDDADAASDLVRSGELSAVILHRTFDVSGVELIRAFRALDPMIPIVMVSGIDREEAALAAGANRFLHYDQWLRIGSVVDSILWHVHHERESVG